MVCKIKKQYCTEQAKDRVEIIIDLDKMWYLGYRGDDNTWQGDSEGYVEFTEGKWQHIAFVKLDVDMMVYKDGILIHTEKNRAGLLYRRASLNFGAWGCAFRFFNGILDEVALFSVALTKEDIKGLMENGLESALGITPVKLSGSLSSTWGSIKADH